jgi:hypothetical protein
MRDYCETTCISIRWKINKQQKACCFKEKKIIKNDCQNLTIKTFRTESGDVYIVFRTFLQTTKEHSITKQYTNFREKHRRKEIKDRSTDLGQHYNEIKCSKKFQN